MEPFRPVIDYVICKTGKPHLSPDFRKKLIDITFQPIHYNGKEWKVGDAMEQFFLDIIAAIETPEARIGGFIIDWSQMCFAPVLRFSDDHAKAEKKISGFSEIPD